MNRTADELDLADIVHGSHRSWCLLDRPCAESRMIAVAVVNAGYRRRRPVVTRTELVLSVGAIVAAMIGVHGVAVGLIVVLSFVSLGTWLSDR